jgi:hypothetical protein
VPLYINGRLQPDPGAVAGAVTYKGTWDAAANNPALTSSVGVQGHYYVVSVAGITDLDGITDWQVGDWAIFNGTVWEKVDNTEPVAIRVYPPSATDPVAPAPQNGDLYFNTVLALTMQYDNVRGKWLSVAVATFTFGRAGVTPTNTYYRMIDGVTMTAARGYTAKFNGTIVAFGYSRDDTDSAPFEVVEGGVLRASVASAAVSGRDSSLNADISQNGILAVRNGGTNAASNANGYVQVRWRV